MGNVPFLPYRGTDTSVIARGEKRESSHLLILSVNTVYVIPLGLCGQWNIISQGYGLFLSWGGRHSSQELQFSEIPALRKVCSRCSG